MKVKPLLSCEVPLDKVNFPIYVSTKYDGCFSWGTKIWTDKGLIPIGKIVDLKMNVKVASYNEVTKEVEFKKVVNWFNNGLKVGGEWRKFGRHMITNTHKVFSNGSWVEAQEYERGGMFVNPRISSVITGMLLGDGVASIDKRHNLSWRLMWSNSINDEGYGDSKMSLIENLFDGRLTRKVHKTSGYGSPVVAYTTPSCTTLPFDISKFYTTDRSDENYGRRKKNLTLDDLCDFDEMSLAIWFFDDGCISYNNGNKQTPRLVFSVPRYSDETHKVFKKLFKNKFNLNPSILKHGKDTSMTFSTPETWYLLSLIASVAGGMCDRKIPDIFNVVPMEKLEKFKTDINTIGRAFPNTSEKKYVAYDIEVEDNHNYFANGMLVHNCRAIVIGGVVYSRSLKPIRNKHVQKLFGKPEYNGFDGELVVGDIYAKDVFQKTTSGVMSAEGEPDVTFYVFDLWDKPELAYVDRQGVLINRVLEINPDPYIEIPLDGGFVKYVVPTYCESASELEALLEVERNLGGEGLIGRDPKGLYKYGRSTPKEQLSIKFKFFENGEFEVVGFTERMHNTNEQTRDALGYAERSSAKEGLVPMDTLGSLILKYGDTTFLCGVGVGLTEELRKFIWNNKEKYLGSLACIRFMTVGMDKLPRLPVLVGFRDLEDISE